MGLSILEKCEGPESPQKELGEVEGVVGMWRAFPTNRKGFSVFVVIASPFLLAGFDFFFFGGGGGTGKSQQNFWFGEVVDDHAQASPSGPDRRGWSKPQQCNWNYRGSLGRKLCWTGGVGKWGGHPHSSQGQRCVLCPWVWFSAILGHPRVCVASINLGG